MADRKWRKGSDGMAHLVSGTRTRCAAGGFPKGPVVPPPTDGDERNYCYSCHYHSLFDVMPKAKATILIKLMNREIENRIRVERDTYRAEVQEREKSLESRSSDIRKREEEFAKSKREQEENKEYIEVGKAFSLLSKEVGKSIMDASMGYYRSRRMGFGW